MNLEEPIEAVSSDGQPLLILSIEKSIALAITGDGRLAYWDLADLTTNRFFNETTGEWDRAPYEFVAEEEPTKKPARRRKSANPPSPPVVSAPVVGALDTSQR